MDPLVWAGLLLLLGLSLVMVEVFVPSGGILGVLSVVAILSAIIMAFTLRGPMAGMTFLSVALFSVPVVLTLAFKWLPETPMGRRLLAALPTSDEVLPDSDERRQLRDLVGKVGRASSVMLPSGAVEVEGLTIDAVSEGMPIEAGQTVRVVSVRGTRVVVRAVSAEPEPAARADDILSQPFDQLGIDPFDDPLESRTV